MNNSGGLSFGDSDSASLLLRGSSLDDVVQALLSGKPIQREGGASDFVFVSGDVRRVFAFYNDRRNFWERTKPIQQSEIDAVLASLQRQPVIRPFTPAARPRGVNRWRLARVTAHRFAGLHRHCGRSGQAPDTFNFEIDKDITLIAGFNGAGKTAIQSAITWCLTNRALRSQHMPTEVHEPMRLRAENSADHEPSDTLDQFAIPPIVPIPSSTELEMLDERLAVDTWVELAFCSEDSGEIRTVRRELVRGPRGGISSIETGLAELAVTDLAIEAGTLMPAIAANMRFDERTTFAQAVAQLTGLKPLDDLGRRIRRLVKRLNTEESQKTERARDAKLVEYQSKKLAIRDAWENQGNLGMPAELIDPQAQPTTPSSESSIIAARSGLEKLRADLESGAAEILGRPLQLNSKAQADELARELSEAADVLKANALKALPSIAMTQRLAAISDDDKARAKELVLEITRRAQDTSVRLRQPLKAARWQLYARVAAWHRENHPDAELTACPVCSTDLSNVPVDALVDLRVKEALQRSLDAHSDVAKNATAWEQDVAREFLDSLPESLRPFADQHLPDAIDEVYRQAYVSELLNQSAFGKTLQPLRSNGATLWDRALEECHLPLPPALIQIDLPAEFGKGALSTRVRNVLKAIRLADHRAFGKEQIRALGERFFGVTRTDEDAGCYKASSPKQAPLRLQVETIRRCVESSAPVASILRQLADLDSCRKEWDREAGRLVLIQRAAGAAQPIGELPELVHEQVTGLIQALEQSTGTWLDRLYRPHYIGGPVYSGFDPTEERGIGLLAGSGGLRVAAHHVMNASHLRACVFAFLFALCERVRERIGGLDCMMLDDPQALFDPTNVDNLAAAIPVLAKAGLRPIVTSNDNRFLAAIREYLPTLPLQQPSWRALQINPISTSRATASLSPMREEIEERLRDWQDDENNAQKAQSFVQRVRVYIENRLWDLLASDPMGLQDPTLADLLNAIRRCRNAGELPFNEHPFENLVSSGALKDNSSFYGIINKAHHVPRDITPSDAAEVRDRFPEVDRLVSSCIASYSRFMGRLVTDEHDLVESVLPPLPNAIPISHLQITVLGEISARSSAHRFADLDGQLLSVAALGDVAFFGVRSASLGTVALPGQVVVASMTREARQNDLVVALHGHKTYLRRYLVDRRDRSRVILVSDLSGSENVAPPLVLPRRQTRVLPIVGVLYDEQRHFGSDEGCAVDGCALLSGQLYAARVIDDSAYPVVRRGDVVLLAYEDIRSKRDIVYLRGHMVAFVATHGGERLAYLKRVSAEFAGTTGVFQNVGVTGTAMIVRAGADDRETDASVCQVDQLWRAVGVLRLA